MKITIAILFSILLFDGCKMDDPNAPVLENPVVTKGVYILNEGGFTKSNSSLSIYVPDSNKVYPDVFNAANNRSLGDVANDIVFYNTKAYIVVNNSHKIEIISTDTHKLLGTISVPGSSPFKIIILNESKGYFTNLYKGTVTAFNPTSYTIIKENIFVGLNPQGITAANGKIFVCNSGYGYDSTISVIDPTIDSVIATIKVGKNPTDISVDNDGEVIVLNNGFTDFSNSSNDTPGSISVIDPKSFSVVSTISLPLALFGHPNELAVSNKGYGFTVVKNGITKFDTKSNLIVSSQFIPKTPYSIAVDNVTERIYLGDAKDYNSNGKIFVYEKNAILKDSVTVGIIPGTIIFKR